MKLVRVMLLAPFVLSACEGTPEQQCKWSAWGEYEIALDNYRQARDNAARGYAVHEQIRESDFETVCFDEDEKPYECVETKIESVETPVAIDVHDERRKAAEYEARLPMLERQARQKEAACLARL